MDFPLAETKDWIRERKCAVLFIVTLRPFEEHVWLFVCCCFFYRDLSHHSIVSCILRVCPWMQLVPFFSWKILISEHGSPSIFCCFETSFFKYERLLSVVKILSVWFTYDIRSSVNQMLQWITINQWHWQLCTGHIHTSCQRKQLVVCCIWCVVSRACQNPM